MSETNEETRGADDRPTFITINPTHDMRCAFALGRVLGAVEGLKKAAEIARAEYNASKETKNLCDLVDIAHERTVEACETAGFDTTLALAHEAAVKGNRTE